MDQKERIRPELIIHHARKDIKKNAQRPDDHHVDKNPISSDIQPRKRKIRYQKYDKNEKRRKNKTEIPHKYLL